MKMSEHRLHLAVTEAGPQGADRPRSRQQEEEQDRPRARRALGRGGDERDGGDVLEDQDADREPAVERLGLAALLQGLDHQHGAGERHREGQQRQGREPLVTEKPQSQQPEDDDEAEDQEHRGSHVETRGHPGLTTQQDAYVELETDAEQQQRDAEVGDEVEAREPLGTEAVEHEAGAEEADQRREPQQPSQDTAQEHRCQVRRRQFHDARQGRPDRGRTVSRPASASGRQGVRGRDRAAGRDTGVPGLTGLPAGGSVRGAAARAARRRPRSPCRPRPRPRRCPRARSRRTAPPAPAARR